eukprot:TRINITY_DN11365_c0_g1_i3.p1 TRINITY_DN11365_c0_g1~~TRINITY_DN11365_c0_g1_i3.p1  ORF type:complete len:274 (-),score=71.66 TRINITY_DN11365_c0_g1_i3:826-1647(-)
MLKHLEKWASEHPFIDGASSGFYSAYDLLTKSSSKAAEEADKGEIEAKSKEKAEQRAKVEEQPKIIRLIDMKEAMSQGKGALNFVTLFDPEEKSEDGRLLLQIKEQLQVAKSELKAALEQNEGHPEASRAQELAGQIEMVQGFIDRAVEGDASAWEKAVSASQESVEQKPPSPSSLKMEEDENDELAEELQEGEFSEQRSISLEMHRLTNKSADMDYLPSKNPTHTLHLAERPCDPLNKSAVVDKVKETEKVTPTKIPSTRRVVVCVMVGAAC